MRSAAQLLDRAAALYGERTALTCLEESLCFRELRRRGRGLAAALGDLGAGPGKPVALYLPKGIDCVVSAFGALYAGAPYAPLDYNCPPARLRAMLDKLAPACVVTDGPGAQALEKAGCALPLVRTEDPKVYEGDFFRAETVDTDPAYIMFTSGSTGVPKGVAISHAAVLDYADWAVRTFGVTPETKFGQQSGFHFDNSIFHIFASAAAGAELVIIPDSLLRFPRQLAAFLGESGINFIFWAPTVLMSIADSGALETVPLPRLKTVLFGGEVMPLPQLEKWRRALPDCRFGNMYGPTEITDVCCFYLLPPGFAPEGDVPIGFPRENMRVRVLDEARRPVAPGEIGELYVSGTGTALGYWNDPEQTAERFVTLPSPASPFERAYRTGDLAYIDGTGAARFCGRADSQIKLRGNRIELSDVEAAAHALPGETNACALFDRERERIVLFLETKEALTLRRVNLLLRERLPAYMLPGSLVCLEAFPLNQNRKVDRMQLKSLIGNLE